MLPESESTPGSRTSTTGSNPSTSKGSPRTSCATTTTRLLPAYDQWVLGPGTADAHVVPPARRQLVSRGANLVVVGGGVSGTWSRSDDELVVDWFTETERLDEDALTTEVDRFATIVGHPLRPTIRTI